ncbi:hypothetical protein [Amphibacillus jilinensis]|nr:hypothetical protein [Amphibacillus jilinensis]
MWRGINDEERFKEGGEGPTKEAHVDSFCIGAYTITNQEFSTETGYQTGG